MKDDGRLVAYAVVIIGSVAAVAVPVAGILGLAWRVFRVAAGV